MSHPTQPNNYLMDIDRHAGLSTGFEWHPVKPAKQLPVSGCASTAKQVDLTHAMAWFLQASGYHPPLLLPPFVDDLVRQQQQQQPPSIPPTLDLCLRIQQPVIDWIPHYAGYCDRVKRNKLKRRGAPIVQLPAGYPEKIHSPLAWTPADLREQIYIFQIAPVEILEAEAALKAFKGKPKLNSLLELPHRLVPGGQKSNAAQRGNSAGSVHCLNVR